MHVSSSSQFWDEMNYKFYKKYHGLDTKHKEWSQIVLQGKPIESMFGRQWQIPLGTKNGEIKIPWTLLTNYPVQGTGADIMMLARISAHRRIKAAKIPCDFISTVHDSIVVDTHTEYLDSLKIIFEEVFRDIPANIKKIFNYDWVTPMACECKFGSNMRDMHKFV
jgi:DNA polymerase I-like protein with 3'-5' exonuclease and polymerase domains